MSSEKLPMVKPAHLIRILEKQGFRRTLISKGGSHLRYCHVDGRRTTVPFHKGYDIGRGLLYKILKDIKITPEEFKKLL